MFLSYIENKGIYIFCNQFLKTISITTLTLYLVEPFKGKMKGQVLVHFFECGHCCFLVLLWRVLRKGYFILWQTEMKETSDANWIIVYAVSSSAI